MRGRPPLEILEELHNRDKNRTPREAEEDRADIEELKHLVELQGQQKAAVAERRAEQERIENDLTAKKISEEKARERDWAAKARSLERQAEIIEKIEPESSGEMKEDVKLLKRIPSEKCTKCGRPATNSINGKFYCAEHSSGAWTKKDVKIFDEGLNRIIRATTAPVTPKEERELTGWPPKQNPITVFPKPAPLPKPAQAVSIKPPPEARTSPMLAQKTVEPVISLPTRTLNVAMNEAPTCPDCGHRLKYEGMEDGEEIWVCENPNCK